MKTIQSKITALLLAIALFLGTFAVSAETATPPEPIMDPEGWYELDGVKTEGALSTLITGLSGKEATIYVIQKSTKIVDIDGRLFVALTFKPDTTAYNSTYSILVTAEDPMKADDPYALENIDFSVYKDLTEEQKITVYIWLRQEKAAPTEEPTQTPTEEPTQTPTEEPTQAPTEEPTQTPTEEPTQAPTEEPTQTPTEEPTQTPTEEPTQTPTEEPTQTPTEEPTQAPTAKPTEEPTVEPTETPVPAVPELTVDTTDVVSVYWSNKVPTFTLSGIPEGSTGYRYAVIREYKFSFLKGNTYTITDEGKTHVRFLIVDSNNTIVSYSKQWVLRLDFTAPMAVAAQHTYRNYTLSLSASDNLSEVVQISVDNGESWHAISSGARWAYDAGADTILPVGGIMVKDLAGNIWTNDTEVHLRRLANPTTPPGGGGNDPAPTVRPVVTAPVQPPVTAAPTYEPYPTEEPEQGGGNEDNYDDYDDTDYYDFVSSEIIAPEMSVWGMIVGDGMFTQRTVNESGEEYESNFFASLAVWDDAEGGLHDEHTGKKTEQDNVILFTADLSVLEDEKDLESLTYIWEYSGYSLAALEKAGIEYIVFRMADRVTVIPTSGVLTEAFTVLMSCSDSQPEDYVYNVSMSFVPSEEEEDVSEWNLTEDCRAVFAIYTMDMEVQLLPCVDEEPFAQNIYCAEADYLDYAIGMYPVLIEREVTANAAS